MQIERVGIIGSGIMGSGISQVAAEGGCDVVLRSRTQEKADATLAAIDKALARKVSKEVITGDEAAAVSARITATSNLKALAECDLVIESVVEDLATKKELFNHLDDLCKPGTILATNTSTLPIVEMAAVTGRPDKVVGIHFFNPAPVMQLVEVARSLTTSDETIEAATAWAEAMGKTPVQVKDRAGFVVNALLFPYLNNAIRLYEAGLASMEDMDTAMTGGCGFPMGPFALLDLVGLDTALSILEALYEEYRDPACAPAPLLKRLVAADRLGRKSGEGFYRYEE